MAWLAGQLQKDFEEATKYVEDHRKIMSRDGFSAWHVSNCIKIIIITVVIAK